MFVRSLPRFADLGGFLDHLGRHDEVATITEPVDMRLELTEIHRRVIASGGPVLRVSHPVTNRGPADMAVVTNLFGTRERVAMGLGTDVAGLEALGEFMAFLRSPKPPKSIGAARDLLPVARAALNTRPRATRDITPWVDLPLDLGRLPIQTCWPNDAGPLITWPLVITRSPGPDDFASYNIGVYRMQVIGQNAAIMRWLPMRGCPTTSSWPG